LSSLHQIIYRFHRYILIIAVLLTLIAVVLTTQLKLDLDLLSLLPSDNPSVRSFFEIAEEIGFQSVLIALVEMPPNCDRMKSEYFIDVLAKNFAQSPLIHKVEYRSGETRLSSLFQKFMVYFPLFLKDRDLKRLTLKLSDAEVHRQVRENKKLLMTPFGIVTTDLVYIDPLGLRELLESNITLSHAKQPMRPHNVFYSTNEGGTYFFFFVPTIPPHYLNFTNN